MSDYIRAKAFASWVFRDDQEIVGIEEYLSQLTSESDTSVDIFGDIAGFYCGVSDLSKYFSADKILRQFEGDKAKGLIFLLLKSLRKQGNFDKFEIRNFLINSLLQNEYKFEKISFNGQFDSIDFSGAEFSNCNFKDVIFKGCQFDVESRFDQCKFESDFSVLSCDGFSEVQVNNSRSLSMQARSTFAAREVTGADRRVTDQDVRQIMNSVLSQMQSGTQRFRDINREGALSRAQKKNSYIAASVLDAMEVCGMLKMSRKQQKHRARIAVDNVSDVMAFYREGAVVGVVRDAVDRVMSKYG